MNKFSEFMNENDKDYKDSLTWEMKYVKEKQENDEANFQMKNTSKRHNKKALLDYYKQTYDQNFAQK